MTEHQAVAEPLSLANEVTLGETNPRPILRDVTVVIPTLGREILRVSLAHMVKANTWPAAIVIVDQGKVPAVSSWLEHVSTLGIEICYVPSDQTGRAAGLNRGIQRVETRFFAVTDDDCFVEPDWLANLVARLRAHPLAIVTGRVEADGSGFQVVVESRIPVVYHKPRLIYDSLSGGNMGTSLAVVARVGPYDEDLRLRTSEDGEWAYRALRAGIPIIYAPEVGVVHYGWRDEHQRADQLRAYALSHGGFYGKYIRKGDGFIVLRAVLHMLRALRRALFGLATRDGELARHGWAYLRGLPVGVFTTLLDKNPR